MDQPSTLTSITKSPLAARQDALARLTIFGWRGGLAAITAGLAVSFLLYGYTLVYWRNADMDFMVIYSALALNDGKPQQFFDHTGYITILTVKAWFELLRGLGLLHFHSLATMPPAAEPEAFDAAMTSAIRAGRVLAWLIATGSVLVFAAFIRIIVRDWRVALTATFAFAFSGAIAVHSRILRTELVAACPVLFALMTLIVIGRVGRVLRPLWMGCAAALCVIGLENKVQSILLISALPLIILPFGGPKSASVAFWRRAHSALPSAILAAAAATAAIWAVWPLIVTGFDPALDAAHFRPLLLGRYGIYQAALVLLIIGCMIIYAALWRISTMETLASVSAMVLGAALALLVLDLEYNARNVIAVFNPLEKMLTFADANTAAAASGSSPLAILGLVLDGLASVFARYTFVLHSSPRPTVFLTWLIAPGIVVAWSRGERQVSLQALVLLLAAIGIDALGVRRGLKSEYFIFTDPLIILAGAILLDCLTDLRFHRWASAVAIILFGLHIAVGQAEPIKYAFMRRGPERICEWNLYYMPLMPLHWCPAARG
jgi:hypothetical protein